MSDRITVVGNVNLDVLVSGVSELPDPGTESVVPAIVLRPGGSAANTAITLARLGRPTLLAGRLGDDTTALLLERELDIPSLDVHLPRADGEHTSVTVAVEAPGKDRAFLSALGAMTGLDGAGVPHDALRARFLLLSGYFLLPGVQGATAAELFDHARAAGARTALDTGWDPAGWPPSTRAEVHDVLRHVDLFLPNDDEVVALAGRTDAAAAAADVAERTGATVVVKCGARGALLAQPGEAVSTYPTPQVRVHDSTGAGDAFNAGLLHRLVDDADLPSAIDYATRVAATVISRPSHDRTFTADEVLAEVTERGV